MKLVERKKKNSQEPVIVMQTHDTLIVISRLVEQAVSDEPSTFIAGEWALV